MFKERKIFIIRVENENIIHGIMSLYPKILGGLILKGRGVPPPPQLLEKAMFQKSLKLTPNVKEN